MDISVRLEGGIGDHLLANRFVFAIKEQNPEDNIIIFSDTDENPVQLNLLKSIWPSIYKDALLAEKRVSKGFEINSQFGREIYNAALENQSSSIKKVIENSDKFYNLCIDNLKWTDYDFDWWRYFYFFPKPEKIKLYNLDLPKEFILANLYSRPDSSFKLEEWYVKRVIEEMTQILPVVIPTTKENKAFYNFCANMKDVHIIVTDLDETFYLASKCSAFIGIDSGIRCMPYYFGKPTFYFSTFCSEYGRVLPSHLLRWVIFEKNVFPMYYNTTLVKSYISTAINKSAGKLFPYLDSTNMDNILVNRKY